MYISRPGCAGDVAPFAAWRAVGLCSDGLHDGDLDGVEVEGMEQLLGVRVDFKACNGGVEGGDLWDVVVLAFALLLLELERDATDGAALDALHEMGCEAGDLVAEALGGDDGDFIDDALVCVEVEGETGIVFFDEYSGRPFRCFCADTTLCNGCEG
jgi:hypothetical protein